MNAAVLLDRPSSSLDKVQSDIERLESLARFVIVIGEGDVQLIDNGHLHKQEKPFARLIAVVAPALYKGRWMRKALILEIGYYKSRPYSRTTLVLDKGFVLGCPPRWEFARRERVRLIREDELAHIFPILNDCFTQIVLENRESWKMKGEYEVMEIKRGASPMHGYWTDRGIRFTLAPSDEIVCRQIFLEDLRYRKERYIADHAKALETWVPSAFAQHSNREFEKRADVYNAEGLLNRYKRPLYLWALYRALPERIRAGIDRVRKLSKHKVSLDSPEIRLVSIPSTVSIPPLTTVRCFVRWNKRTQQAPNSLMCEMLLERRFREANEIYSESENGAAEFVDDEIPF